MNTPTNASIDLPVLLEKINFHLKNNDLPSLERTINSGDTAVILSDATLATARAMGSRNLVLLLASLAVDTGVDVATAEVWRDIYLSIKERALIGKAQGIRESNVLGQVIRLLIGSTALTPGTFSKAAGTETEFACAFEIACDFQRWDIADAILATRVKGKTHLKTCLTIAKSIMQRQRYLRSETGQRHFASFLERILQAGSSVLSPEASETLRMIMAAAHQTGGNHAEALRIYQSIASGKDKLIVYSEIARAHCKMGNLADAIAYLDKSISVLIEHKTSSKPPRPLPLILQTPADANYTVDRACAALRDIAMLAQLAGQKLFLVSGTLLGFAREKNLMAHDKDVDLGIMGHVGLAQLVRMGIESKLFHIPPQYLKGKETVQVPFIHTPTGVWIDLFVYSERDGGLVTGVDFQFGYRQTFKFTPFDLVPIDFLNVSLHAPADIDRNLQENFGNWKTPDPSYISHLESPSTMDKGGWVHLLTARIWIIRAIQEGKTLRLQKAIACLRKYPQNPGAPTPEMLSQLDRYLAYSMASNTQASTGEKAAEDEQIAELATP